MRFLPLIWFTLILLQNCASSQMQISFEYRFNSSLHCFVYLFASLFLSFFVFVLYFRFLYVKSAANECTIWTLSISYTFVALCFNLKKYFFIFFNVLLCALILKIKPFVFSVISLLFWMHSIQSEFEWLVFGFIIFFGSSQLSCSFVSLCKVRNVQCIAKRFLTRTYTTHLILKMVNTIYFAWSVYI